MRKKYYTVNGITGTITELSNYYGVNHNTVRTRLRKGLTLDKALSDSPLGSPSYPEEFVVKGVKGSLKNLSNHFGINYSTLMRRVSKGMSLEEALTKKPRSGVYPRTRKRGKVYTVESISGTIEELSKHYGVNYGTVRTRLFNGMSLEKALLTPVKK